MMNVRDFPDAFLRQFTIFCDVVRLMLAPDRPGREACGRQLRLPDQNDSRCISETALSVSRSSQLSAEVSAGALEYRPIT